MTTESFLTFLTAHNTTIIEALIGATLLISLFLAVRSFVAAKDPVPGLAGLGDLEESLKKIIAQAGSIPSAGAVAAAGGGEESQKLSAEIARLKGDLETKQKEIEKLASQPAAAGAAAAATPGMSADDKAKLEAQLKELEAKLSEYEIISEDIADLSYYKEQNAELQKTVNALKAGGAAGAPPGAAPAAAPATPPAAEPTFAGKSKAAEAAAAAAAAAPAVEAPPPAAAPPQTAVATPATAAPTDNTIDDSLMAGFDEAVKSQAPAAAGAEFDLGVMDVDKMLNEAAEIKAEPSGEVDIEKELSGGVDEDKLLKEATALDTVNPEDKRLMGQFENFVKKGE